MDIERAVEYRKMVGFQCDMCFKSFSHNMDYSELPFSRKSTYHFNDYTVHPKDFIVSHFCELCTCKIRSFLEEENVRLNRI